MLDENDFVLDLGHAISIEGTKISELSFETELISELAKLFGDSNEHTLTESLAHWSGVDEQP